MNKNEDEIDKLIKETKHEYLARINEEEKLKNSILDMLDRQKAMIEGQFNEYRTDMEEDQVNFIKWSKAMKHDFSNSGKKVLIENWKKQLQQQERQRLLLRDRARNHQKNMQRNMLDKKLAMAQFNVRGVKSHPFFRLITSSLFVECLKESLIPFLRIGSESSHQVM